MLLLYFMLDKPVPTGVVSKINNTIKITLNIERQYGKTL
jgi:hypothetical protein